MSSRNNVPDASNLIIAAQNDSSEDSATGIMRRSRSRSSNGGGGGGGGHDANLINPHDYDQSHERSGGDPEAHFAQKPHQSVGFWHTKMSKVRKHVLVMWARTIVILMCFVMAVLSLYWAVLFSVDQNMRHLGVHVVDFDGRVAPYDGVTPLVGPAVTQLTEKMYSSPAPSLGYKTVDPAQYDYDPTNVRQGVYDFDSWAAIIINPNATALLQQAVLTGNASYDPTGAIQIIVQTARQESTYYNYILPQLQMLQTQFAAQFGATWSRMLMSNSSYSTQMMARAPAAVNPGVSPLQIDLRPFMPATATPAVTIGLIYLIIVAFFSFSFFLPIHTKYITPQGHPPLHFWQFIVWRWVATIVSYLFISLTYSLVSLAFQIPFWPPPASPTQVALSATAYGRGSFPVYWMLNFVGMAALGIACENVAMVIGQPWTALWLIFWVITNVSTSFYTIELSPIFFRWGYAWPLHHIVQASRQIIFDLHSQIGLNFGVLFAWVAVNTVLFPFCCYFMRWNTEREKRAAEKDKDRYVVHTEDGDKEFEKKEGDKPPKQKRGFMRGM
ncbi:Uu.00g076990.m01.CDS01 [Anthostomella pinea]|uniref:Uu.00g076990.m01.CDS01 n=1 Tax=Anthostomella pinea TaxID=933095 RepID=A0AAI8VWP2_9PEZI|nr:Uu.00g076990.m01.CDS01 [Anthostomella pinea]